MVADIKPVSILPSVESFLQGQQSHGPGRRGEGNYDVLQTPCELSAHAAAELPGPGADRPAPRLQRATSHSEEAIAESRQHPEAATGQTRVRSGAKTSPETAVAESRTSSRGAGRESRRTASIARGPPAPKKWVVMAVVPAEVKI